MSTRTVEADDGMRPSESERGVDYRVATRSSEALTDSGNAERLVARYGDRLRYVHAWERWATWDGTRWALDDRREVYRLALDTVRSIYVEAAAAGEHSRDLARHAIRSEQRHAIDNMLALARSFPPVACVPDDLDRNGDLLNVQNGTVDLRSGELRPHDPAHLITKLVPVPFEPRAQAPRWTRFLTEIVPDADVLAYLQRAVGYSLSGNVSEHVLFFCHGGGANGKTTFVETVRALLGEGEYARAAAPDLLLAKRQDRHAVEVADLRGARFVTTAEVGEGRSWDEVRVKWLTGGDTISARFLYSNPFSFVPVHKLWIVGNHKPRVHGTDLGFWRRVHLVPFTVTIPKERQEPDLLDHLQHELPGILRWAVQGCLAWRQGGLQPPPAVLAAVQAYRSAEDVLGLFLAECCVTGTRYSAPVGDLYRAFREWAERSGERDISKRAFGEALEEHGHPPDRSGNARFRRGLALRTEGSP